MKKVHLKKHSLNNQKKALQTLVWRLSRSENAYIKTDFKNIPKKEMLMMFNNQPLTQGRSYSCKKPNNQTKEDLITFRHNQTKGDSTILRNNPIKGCLIILLNKPKEI